MKPRGIMNAHRQTISGWSSNTAIPNLWNTISDMNEVSPPGFRRPTDGSISANEEWTKVTSLNSEFRQSLFQWHGTGSNSTALQSTDNSVWGYYADGFFDRRPLENSVNNIGNTSVFYGNRDVAYIGRLFFNALVNSERYNASLFFPAGGHRYYTTGDLTKSGYEGFYWSSTSNDTGNAESMRLIWEHHAAMWRSEKGMGNMIRPVKE
jgi:hypothetical protein